MLKETRKELYTTQAEILEAVKENRKPRIVGLLNISRYLNDKLNIKLSRQYISRKLKKSNILINEGHYRYKLTEKEIALIFKK